MSERRSRPGVAAEPGRRKGDHSDAYAEFEARREAEREKSQVWYERQWNREHDDKKTWSPYLLIRYGGSDTGQRPMPAGEAHWVSPDIWIESSDALGRAVAGQPNYVHTRIYNLGMANAAPTRVDFYWANPALGLGPAQMNLIATEWLEIPAQSLVDVRARTPWVPTFLNGGHECLLVQCDNHVLDPLIYPFQPRLDRHVGQRNISVVDVQTSMRIELDLELHNIFPIAAETLVIARTHALRAIGAERLAARESVEHVIEFGIEGRRAQTINDPTGRGRLAAADRLASSPRNAASPRLERTAARGTAIHAELGEAVAGLVPERPGALFANLLLAEGELATTELIPGEEVVGRVGMQAFERRSMRVSLTVPADLGAQEFAVFQIEQRTAGALVGGYTVVARRPDGARPQEAVQGRDETGGHMKERGITDEQVLRLIVEEVDQAHDALELVEQLAPALPLRNFEEIRRKLRRDTVTFRGVEFDLAELETQFPRYAFPVEDVEMLVERVAHLVRFVPDHVGMDAPDGAYARRRLRRLAMGQGSNGLPQQAGLSRALRPGPEPRSKQEGTHGMG